MPCSAIDEVVIIYPMVSACLAKEAQYLLTCTTAAPTISGILHWVKCVRTVPFERWPFRKREGLHLLQGWANLLQQSDQQYTDWIALSMSASIVVACATEATRI